MLKFRKKLGKNKSTSSKEELHDLHEQKQREYINFLKVALQRIQKRKNDLREAIEVRPCIKILY